MVPAGQPVDARIPQPGDQVFRRQQVGELVSATSAGWRRRHPDAAVANCGGAEVLDVVVALVLGGPRQGPQLLVYMHVERVSARASRGAACSRLWPGSGTSSPAGGVP